MTQRKTVNKSKSRIHSTTQISSLPVHDLSGVVVFPMSGELQTILGKEGYETVSADLYSRDFKLICRTPEVVVYVQLTPMVVPMDLLSAKVPSTPAVSTAKRRKPVKKPGNPSVRTSSTNKS